MNKESVRLTKLFESCDRRSVILKGQANARLYPDPFSRQPGDIDIWVSGGKPDVLQLLDDLKLQMDVSPSAYHAQLKKNENGITVEVHFCPSSGNFNPVTTKRMMKFLESELENSILAEEGFYVPSNKFALVMQLSHIQRHFVVEGVGLRQLMDYHVLLTLSTEKERREVAAVLDAFGLKPMAGAVMWLLHKTLGLSENNFLCEPDAGRGRKLLAETMHTGNFGGHGDGLQKKWLFWWMERRVRNLKNMFFNPAEIFFAEICYWIKMVKNMPVRIRLRKISLRGEKW